MTPTDKAEELVKKFLFNKTHSLDHIDEAKQCALICVDEIIEAEKKIFSPSHVCFYWQQVKEEIEKL